jgi:hypothetical protein
MGRNQWVSGWRHCHSPALWCKQCMEPGAAGSCEACGVGVGREPDAGRAGRAGPCVGVPLGLRCKCACLCVGLLFPGATPHGSR